MNEPDARRRPRKPLIEGVKMRCPRCERLDHIFNYVRLKTIQEYSDQTAPVYKCPRNRGGCGFLFAPMDPHEESGG